MAIAALNC